MKMLADGLAQWLFGNNDLLVSAIIMKKHEKKEIKKTKENILKIPQEKLFISIAVRRNAGF